MIRVERTERDVLAGGVEALLEALDSRLGTWLGCDVEAEGLYQRESMGCVDPAVGFFLDGNLLTVRSFSPVGHALLEKIRPLAVFEPAPGGLVIRFAETKSVPHPVIGVLRAFLGQFACGSPATRQTGRAAWNRLRTAPSTAW